MAQPTTSNYYEYNKMILKDKNQDNVKKHFLNNTNNIIKEFRNTLLM